MAYLNKLFNSNFLEYASYVIKDRAIPHVNDGLKPVQRRILHSLFEMDDGKFNKVANVVGHCMRYHPHGDASIFSALVVLANKELFIEKQGNYGNIFTGDEASAARYIECRLLPFAAQVLYNPEITTHTDSYDGRNREPVTMPAKIPVVLAIGAEGIAVGMATKILPHNLIELLEAQIAHLQGDQFLVYPDFPTGGFVDVSEYNDGNGKVLVRARLDTSDPKRIVIREIPFSTTTESLIASIEDAARSNKIKIAGIYDYTAEVVEIEVRLARGVHTADVVDALYAFTDCEMSLSLSLMVIKDDKPTVMSVSQVIGHSAAQLVEVLRAELELERGKLLDRLHARTLEQIFIENRLYKLIEDKDSVEAVMKAVYKGLRPFAESFVREVTDEDVERLLKIVIRRISLYDINRAREEVREIHVRLGEIQAHLEDLVGYAVAFLDEVCARRRELHPRKTEIISFEKVDAREAAQRNLKLRYDRNTGYLGYEVNGQALMDVSGYDRVLVLRKTGAYSVIDVPDKMFVDKGMLYCGLTDKTLVEDRVFTLVYKDKKSGAPFIKRCKIDKWILNRGYMLVPEGAVVLRLSVERNLSIVVDYKPRPRVRVLQETFAAEDFLVKGTRAGGVRLANREVKSVRFIKGDGSSCDEGEGGGDTPDLETGA